MKVNIFAVVFFVGLLLIGLSYFIYDEAEREIKIVDCYDKHNNKIIDLECEQLHTVIDTNKIIFSITIGVGLIITYVSGMLWAIYKIPGTHNDDDDTDYG